MNIDFEAVETLSFGDGENAFSLRVQLPTGTVRARIEDALAAARTAGGDPNLRLLAAVRPMVVGWSGVNDKQGRPLEFSVDRLDALLGAIPVALFGAVGTALASFAGYGAADDGADPIAPPAGGRPGGASSG
ncbi:MAG: hypothetical protein U1A27_00075 [Phycisphaerae bacterium]